MPAGVLARAWLAARLAWLAWVLPRGRAPGLTARFGTGMVARFEACLAARFEARFEAGSGPG